MKIKVFSVYDKKANGYQNPFFQQTVGLAERVFRTAANDSKTQICMYPEDYELYYIADYDDEKGEYINLDSKVRVCGAKDVKEATDDKVLHAVQQTASN